VINFTCPPDQPCSRDDIDNQASISCGTCRDDDNDLYTTCEGDCNDTNTLEGFNTNPGAVERCGNGRDDNCNRQTDETPCCDDSDADGDTYSLCDGDCDDTDPNRIHDCPVCTGEECQNDAPDDRDGNTIGLQTDQGQCPCASPVLVDVLGDGFRLTDLAGGVRFDLNGDGRAGRLAWTEAGTDDAWLALDRDGDGLIASGRELFGDLTEQPTPPAGELRNGFLALAEFDKPQLGGNSDGVIDSRDAVFAHLRLWRDSNHDGTSQPEELYALAALDVARLHLSYKESRREDGHGNRFRFRAKLDDARGAKVNRWAWDVFLLSAP